jgi:hypothetical protein
MNAFVVGTTNVKKMNFVQAPCLVARPATYQYRVVLGHDLVLDPEPLEVAPLSQQCETSDLEYIEL